MDTAVCWCFIGGRQSLSEKHMLGEVKQGDYWFLPYSAKNKFDVESKDCVMVECLPSKQPL